MPSSSRKKSYKKNNALKYWVQAAQANGYMIKGEHKLVPKKGTSGYKAIRKTYDRMMSNKSK